MNFNNATLLTLNTSSNFLGETARFKSTKELTIQGLLLDLTNSSGVQDIVTAMSNLEIATKYNWVPVTLNGINFGSGIVNSLSFSEGNDVRTKTYTASISIPVTGDFSLVSTGPYQGLNYNNFQYIESFSESSDFTKDVGKDSYSQQISITLTAPTNLNAINEAKTLATTFFNNNNLSNTIGAFTSFTSTKKYYTESYDEINGTFNFSRQFELYKNSDGNFSSSISHSLSFDDQGVISVSETAEYIGHTTSAFSTANTQALLDINGAFGRCESIFITYFGYIGNTPLAAQPLNKSWTIDPFLGKINYTVNFGNALRVGVNAFHEYSQTANMSPEGIYELSQDGNIIGFGEINPYNNIKYTNAKNLFNSLSIIFANYPSSQLISKDETHSEINGTINYNYKYSTSTNLINNSSIRKAMCTISKDFKRNIFSTFNIIGFKEIAQIQKNTLPNDYNYNVVVNGSASTSINSYLSYANSMINSNLPPTPRYLSNYNYSFDPFERELTLQVTYFSLSN